MSCSEGEDSDWYGDDEEAEEEPVGRGAWPGFRGLRHINVSGDEAEEEDDGDDPRPDEEGVEEDGVRTVPAVSAWTECATEPHVVQVLEQLELYLSRPFNPARAGRMLSAATIRKHLRNVARFVNFAGNHPRPPVRDLSAALGDPTLLTSFADYYSRFYKSATLRAYLESLLHLSDCLRAQRGYDAWRQTRFWLGNLRGQALYYAGVENKYVPPARAPWSLWQLQVFRAAAIADYLAHYEGDCRACSLGLNRANYVEQRERLLRPLYVAALCLTLVPPVSRSFILAYLELHRSLQRDSKGFWCLSLVDPFALSTLNNKTRTQHGGFRIPLCPQDWPTDDFPADLAPVGFVRDRHTSGYSSLLDFCLLDIEQRVWPALTGLTGEPAAARLLFPGALAYKTYDNWASDEASRRRPLRPAEWANFFRSILQHYAPLIRITADRGRQVDWLEKGIGPANKDWARDFTPKATRPLSETMLHDLEASDLPGLLNIPSLPAYHSSLSTDDLGILARGAQHTLRTVQNSYILPIFFERRGRELVNWIDLVLRPPQWHASFDSVGKHFSVRVSPAAQELTERFSPEGTALEPLPESARRKREADLEALSQLRGWDIIRGTASLRAAAETAAGAPPGGEGGSNPGRDDDEEEDKKTHPDTPVQNLPPRAKRAAAARRRTSAGGPPPVLGFEVQGFQQVALRWGTRYNQPRRFWEEFATEQDRQNHRWQKYTAWAPLSEEELEQVKLGFNQENEYWAEVQRLMRLGEQEQEIELIPPTDRWAHPRDSKYQKSDRLDVRYAYRFLVKDFKYGHWPSQYLFTSDILEYYGGPSNRSKRTAVLISLQNFLQNRLVVQEVTPFPGRRDLAIVKFATGAPDRTGQELSSEYWGPFFERNWCIFPVDLLKANSDISEAAWAKRWNLLGGRERLGTLDREALPEPMRPAKLYIPKQVVAAIRDKL